MTTRHWARWQRLTPSAGRLLLLGSSIRGLQNLPMRETVHWRGSLGAKHRLPKARHPVLSSLSILESFDRIEKIRFRSGWDRHSIRPLTELPCDVPPVGAFKSV